MPPVSALLHLRPKAAAPKRLARAGYHEEGKRERDTRKILGRKQKQDPNLEDIRSACSGLQSPASRFGDTSSFRP